MNGSQSPLSRSGSPTRPEAIGFQSAYEEDHLVPPSRLEPVAEEFPGFTKASSSFLAPLTTNQGKLVVLVINVFSRRPQAIMGRIPMAMVNTETM